jgi:hypothetical protein
MPLPTKLSERLDDARRALGDLYGTAVALDNRADKAVKRAVEAEEQAEKDREARQLADAKLSEAWQEAIDARAEAAGEIAQLKASNELLAQRDREARDETRTTRFTRTHLVASAEPLRLVVDDPEATGRLSRSSSYN